MNIWYPLLISHKRLTDERKHGHGQGQGQGQVSDHRIFSSSSFVSGFSQQALGPSSVTVPPSPLSQSSSWRDRHCSRRSAHDCTNSVPSSTSSSSLSPSPSSPGMSDCTANNRVDSNGAKNLNERQDSKNLKYDQGPYDRIDRKDEKEDRKNLCPLETQEILLFYSISLLHMLALDSYKVR